MWTPKAGYLSQFKWVELAKYVPDLNSVIREKKGPKNNRVPVLVEWDDVEAYVQKHNSTGIYTSVWRFKDQRISTESNVKLGNLYFDFDSPTLASSQADAIKLYKELSKHIPRSGIRVYFSGSKGIHIECEAVTLGITPRSDLSTVFRFIAEHLRDTLELPTLDFQVYDERRMWRVPYTRHQHSNLFKCEISEGIFYGDVDGIPSWASNPTRLEVPEQRFNFKANEWYREFTYKVEEQSQTNYTVNDLIERFKQRGTGGMHKDEGVKEFDPVTLFENCHAITDWWKYAEDNHDLPHEARLFLCSILSYSDEALEYLHSILSNCADYNKEKSQAHINDWIRRREMGIGGRPYSCDKANAIGVGCKDCNLNPKKKWIKVGDTYVESEEESKPSPIRFAYNRKG